MLNLNKEFSSLRKRVKELEIEVNLIRDIFKECESYEIYYNGKNFSLKKILIRLHELKFFISCEIDRCLIPYLRRKESDYPPMFEELSDRLHETSQVLMIFKRDFIVK